MVDESSIEPNNAQIVLFLIIQITRSKSVEIGTFCKLISQISLLDLRYPKHTVLHTEIEPLDSVLFTNILSQLQPIF